MSHFLGALSLITMCIRARADSARKCCHPFLEASWKLLGCRQRCCCGLADCTFADYGPQTTPLQMKGPSATAAFLRCTFASARSAPGDWRPPAAILAAQQGAHVRLQESTFEVVPGQQSAQLAVRFYSSKFSTCCVT
jgi:hypothetical protein